MYTGITGKVMIGGRAVAYISNWSVDDSIEIIEFASLGQRFKNKVAGQVSWTASADGTVCFGANGEGDHAELFKAMHEGRTVQCDFFLDDKSSVPVKFGGKGLIESLSVDLSAEDKGNISISISGCGELSYPGKPLSTT